jgi:hypothetical protein
VICAVLVDDLLLRWPLSGAKTLFSIIAAPTQTRNNRPCTQGIV